MTCASCGCSEHMHETVEYRGTDKPRRCMNCKCQGFIHGGTAIPSGRFCMVQDMDCHWYVIPVERIAEWHKWRDLPELTDMCPPDWVTRVGGSPMLVTFTDPKVDR